MSEATPGCPQCGKPLKKVRYNSDSPYNRDQWESMRAGDWYCDNCTGDEAKSGHKYYWDSELKIESFEPSVQHCGGFLLYGDHKWWKDDVINREKVKLDRRIEELEHTLIRIDQMLRVPAAEYVPALSDVFEEIEKAVPCKPY